MFKMISSVLLYGETFWITPPFFKQSAPNDSKWETLVCSRSTIPICRLHTSPRSTFSSASLYDELFLSYGPILGKVYWMTLNDLNIFKIKHTCIQHTSPRPQFSSISLYNELVSKYGPILREVHRTTPKWPWYFKVKSIHIYTTYIPEAQMTMHSWVTALLTKVL